MTTTESALCARSIRKELKETFKSEGFSVSSKNYSGGSSVRVELKNLNNPLNSESILIIRIRKIIGKYQYGKFNSSEDIYEITNNNEDVPQVSHVFFDYTYDNKENYPNY